MKGLLCCIIAIALTSCGSGVGQVISTGIDTYNTFSNKDIPHSERIKEIALTLDQVMNQWGQNLEYNSTVTSVPVNYGKTTKENRYGDAVKTTAPTVNTSTTATVQNPSPPTVSSTPKENIVKIEQLKIAPPVASPGGNVSLEGYYYVMTPTESSQINITESRTIAYYDNGILKRFNPPAETSLDIEPGTRKATGKFEIPNNLPAGKYAIIFAVNANGKYDEKTVEFSVR